MAPLVALQSAPHAVEFPGVDDDRELLAPGSLADLVAVFGNPLEDITVSGVTQCSAASRPNARWAARTRGWSSGSASCQRSMNRA